jgi:putative flippase GtrA
LRELLAKISGSQKLSIQIVKYIVAGAISAGIEILLLIYLVEVFVLHYLTANLMAFLFTNIVNYTLSRFWVFEGGKYKPKVEVVAFFVVVFIGLGINQIIMYMLVGNVNIDYRFAKIIAIGFAVIWNFLGKKFLVFKN